MNERYGVAQIHRLRWWWSNGFTFGNHIVIRRRVGHGAHFHRLMLHELEHVKQQDDLGVVRFLYSYLKEYFQHLWRLKNHRAAYRAISFEVEARNAENR